jgi:Secretion system C-terminal sorting domain
MKKLIAAAIAFACLTIVTAATPYICFTDLTSGPSSGNSDNSQPGQLAGQDGAIVTLWGKNLGATQAGSQVLVGGQNVRIYSWRNATAPADVHSRLGLQMIEFQIPGTLSNGVTDIKVVVGGVTSNALSFTIRDGNIYFLKTTGNDNTGNGSWANPWATLDNLTNTGALDKITVGDIIYLCDGVTHTVNAGDRAAIDLGNPGTVVSPKAIIGYPGANASIGSSAFEKSYALWVSGFGPTINWVISKLHLTAASDAAAMYHGFRVIGNKITAPNGDGPSGAVPGQGNNLYLLGNELTNIGFAGTSKLYHPIYFQSAELCSGLRLPTESNREIAWNDIHDNLSFDGINIYRECGSSAYMTNHRVHDNYILNQTGCGIRIGDYVVGENWFYNNVVINAGLGPDPTTEEAMHIPVYIHPGWNDTTTLIHFYNNTIHGGGFTGGAAWASSMVGFANTHPFALDFRNNIIVSTIAGVEYLNPALSVPAGGVEKNIWHGAGAAPSWDINPIAANPLFANAAGNNFHLLNGSPGVNAATPLTATLAQPIPAYDFDAVVRPQNLVADIGVFEFENTIVLPLSWVNTDVKRVNQSQAAVSWQVSNEVNVKGYIVEYSTDGINFFKACSIFANSSENYSCLAPAPANIKYYYRVMQHDYDGQRSYSKIVVLQGNKQPVLFQVSPNPAGDNAVLSYSVSAEKNITLLLYNSTGATVLTQIFQANTSGAKTISLQKLPAGFYWLRINVDNEWQTIRLIKK